MAGHIPGQGMSNCVMGGSVVFMSHVLPCRPAAGSPYTASPAGTDPQNPKPCSCGSAAIANPPRTPSDVNVDTADELTGFGRGPVSLFEVKSMAWRVWKAPGPNQTGGTVPVKRLQDTSRSVRLENTPSWAHSGGSCPAGTGRETAEGRVCSTCTALMYTCTAETSRGPAERHVCSACTALKYS